MNDSRSQPRSQANPYWHPQNQPVEHQTPRRWLAGYVLNPNAALDLTSKLSGKPIPAAPEGGLVLPALTSIHGILEKHLRSKGIDPRVEVQFVGSMSLLETILATSGNRGGLKTEPFKGKADEAIREWLETNGNPRSFPISCHVLTSSKGVKPEEYRWEIHTD